MFKMLSVVVFALIFSAVSAQEVSCPDLLDSLLICAGNESPTEEIVAIPVTCVEEAGASVEDLGACGLLDIPPSPETEVVEGEEEDTSEPVTLTIGGESPDTVTLTILPEEPVAPEPVRFIIIYVPAPVAVPVPAPVAPAPVTPTPTPVPAPPVYAVAAAGASASASGGAASADAAAVASIFS